MGPHAWGEEVAECSSLFGCSLPVLLQMLRLDLIDEKGNLREFPGDEQQFKAAIRNYTAFPIDTYETPGWAPHQGG